MSLFFHLPFLLAYLVLLLLYQQKSTNAFQTSRTTKSVKTITPLKRLHHYNLPIVSSSKNDDDENKNINSRKRKKNENEILTLDELKTELTLYLIKRKQVGADTAAQAQIGTVVGGTKGNPILEYVSGAPNKAITIEEAPRVLDYDELSRYGYGYLVKSIMQQGGRNAMYDLMGLERPPPPKRLKPKGPPPKLVIDKSGETDQGRYSGLKMGALMDDDAMARALAEAQKKTKEGKPLRSKIFEEDYIQPFAGTCCIVYLCYYCYDGLFIIECRDMRLCPVYAENTKQNKTNLRPLSHISVETIDKRNISPNMTPDWTPEKLDEAAKARGRSLSWARRAKLGEFIGDPYERFDLPLSFQLYSIGAALLVAFAFGRSTPQLLDMLDVAPKSAELLQAPALAILLASLGSAVVNGAVLAPSKNRGKIIWTVKGLMAGPLALLQLRELGDLITRQEEEDRQRQS